ncbi:MAG: aldo/keto reductase [Phycisphaerales bacterium JB038]
MQLRRLGNTGIDVSPIGLGTVKIGRNQGVKYPHEFELPEDDVVRGLLAAARDLGVNLIDTAPAYGTSEERLGPLLAAERDAWIIVSKVGEEFEAGVSSFNFSPEHTRSSVERSLQRLRTDRLDCVLVHSDGNDETIIDSMGTLQALADLKTRGLIRSFGMSTKTIAGSRQAMPTCDVLMLTYNQREPEMGPIIVEAAAAGVGVLIKKGFASGHLTEKTVPDTVSRCDEPVAAALRFIFARPGVSSVITGTLSPVHLQQNVDAAERAIRD